MINGEGALGPVGGNPDAWGGRMCMKGNGGPPCNPCGGYMGLPGGMPVGMGIPRGGIPRGGMKAGMGGPPAGMREGRGRNPGDMAGDMAGDMPEGGIIMPGAADCFAGSSRGVDGALGNWVPGGKGLGYGDKIGCGRMPVGGCPFAPAGNTGFFGPREAM